MKYSVLGCLVLCSIGCEPVDPDPDPNPEQVQHSGEIELGWGENALFEPITEEARLIAGSQGGFHLLLTMRLRGFVAGKEVKVSRSARRAEDGALVSRYDYRTNLAPMADEGVTALEREVPMFLCPAPIGVSVADTLLEVKVEISGDSSAAETIRFIARCPEGDEFCRNICAR